ncbi:PH domain-containing protein [Streptomyces sp. NBC_01012]|uniref:PH domain-containing protein n=1 Tax=Streptomyces sp. NBC_01012 TaxID=2903717 RepID=UPI003867D104|nr:PH domain-containing protein [Streptomyces sp. NBC_01012]
MGGNQHILDVLDVLHRDHLALRIHEGAFSAMGLTARHPRTGELLSTVKFMVQTLAAAGELQRELTYDGLRAAEAKGSKGGRRPAVAAAQTADVRTAYLEGRGKTVVHEDRLVARRLFHTVRITWSEILDLGPERGPSSSRTMVLTRDGELLPLMYVGADQAEVSSLTELWQRGRGDDWAPPTDHLVWLTESRHRARTAATVTAIFWYIGSMLLLVFGGGAHGTLAQPDEVPLAFQVAGFIPPLASWAGYRFTHRRRLHALTAVELAGVFRSAVLSWMIAGCWSRWKRWGSSQTGARPFGSARRWLPPRRCGAAVRREWAANITWSGLLKRTRPGAVTLDRPLHFPPGYMRRKTVGSSFGGGWA